MTQVTMQNVRSIIQRLQRKVSDRSIACDLIRLGNMEKLYVDRFNACGFSLEELQQMDVAGSCCDTCLEL